MMDYVQLNVDASVFWTPIGPAPLLVDSLTPLQTAQGLPLFQGNGPDSGEVTDIAIDPNGTADEIIYIATNDGGIWKTEDKGFSWESTMDDLLGLSMGAVAIDPSSPAISRVIYAGTGNIYDGGGEFNKGVGLYRSSDGGSTWGIVDGGPFGTVFAGAFITAIVVLAADTLLVGTNKGLFRSVDGGQHFGSNSPTFDNHQPVVAGLIMCVMQDAAQPATTVYVGVATVGVMKSTDAGVTFPPPNLFGPVNVAPNQLGNIEITQSELNPQVLLVSAQTGARPNGVYLGLYLSTDGGTNWTLVPTLSAVANADGFGQTDYDLTIGIDPVIPVSAGVPPTGLIYAGFQELWRSQNGGQAFEVQACTANQTHWDQHVLRFSPKPNRTAGAITTTAYVGTDGGIWRSTDGGTTWVPINGNIGSNLLFGIDIGKGAGNAYTYGGCQDTGTAARRPGDPLTNWHLGIDGDGRQVAVDPAVPTTAYGFDGGGLIKTIDAGANWQFLAGLPPTGGVPPVIALEQNGIDATKRILYIGTLQTVYKSIDAGVTFTLTPLATGGWVTAIATTAADSSRIWVGSSDGSVHYSGDAGLTWDKAPLVQQPGGVGSVTGVAIDPKTPDRVAVVYAGVTGIHSKYRTKRVFLTSDNGATWNDVSGTDGNGPLGNLPDLPMHSVVFDTSTPTPALVVASDAGVMRCTDVNVSGSTVTATWLAYGVGLPTVSCSSLAIDNTVNPPVLRVGTYGRSCFEVTRPVPGSARLYVGPNLGFGAVPTAPGSGSLSLYTYNCGANPLIINSISIAGSANFAFNPAPAFPVTVDPGATSTFTLVFTPATVGDDLALLSIISNDPASPYALSATGRGVAPGAPRLATNPVAQTNLGATGKDARSVPLQLFNIGTKTLNISAINLAKGSSDFSLNPAPTFPIQIAPGGETDVTISYQPSGNGPATATFQIVSDDPQNPLNFTVGGTGAAVSGSLWPIVLLALGAALLIGGVIGYEELKKN
jgi:photosystem II stability/assembly factor-like uncharacterized protein